MWRVISDLFSFLSGSDELTVSDSRNQKEKSSPVEHDDEKDKAEEEFSSAASSRLKSSPSQDPIRKELLKEEGPARELATNWQHDRQWLSCLAGPSEWLQSENESGAAHPDAARQTYALCCNLFEFLGNYVQQFNAFNGLVNSKITLTPPSEVTERRMSDGQWRKVEQVSYLRWRASTRALSISCRARDAVIEFFLIPISDVMLLSGGEQPFRQRLKLELSRHEDSWVWTSERLPAAADDLRVHMRQLLKELVRSTQDYEQPGPEMLEGASSSATNSIGQLILERQNLAQKVVIQQEEIQKRIARDLHDAVISDVMALKRSLSSEKIMAPQEVIGSLEVIVQRLREVCYELSPRDLADWGLSTVIEDILEHMAQRTGADCMLNCDVDIPALPAIVELHVYRIVQESLNNIEKYARATRVAVTIELEGGALRIMVSDNGKGFEPESMGQREDKMSGYGMSSLRERADLISSFYPAWINIESVPGKGSRVILEIKLPAATAP